MTFPIVIRSLQNGWTERRGTCSVQPSASGVTALLKNLSGRGGATASSAIYARDVSRDRAIAILGRLETPRSSQRLPAHLFQSASLPRADTGGLSALLLPRPVRLRFFNSIGAFKALRSLSFPLRVQPAKQSRGGFTDSLRSFACVSLHAQQQSMEFDAWRTEKLSLRNHNQGMSV